PLSLRAAQAGLAVMASRVRGLTFTLASTARPAERAACANVVSRRSPSAPSPAGRTTPWTENLRHWSLHQAASATAPSARSTEHHVLAERQAAALFDEAPPRIIAARAWREGRSGPAPAIDRFCGTASSVPP